jgi:hypothetical protein
MDDLPDDVKRLQERLVTARTEYRKLLDSRIAFEVRAVYHELLTMKALAVLNGEAGPDLIAGDKYQPPEDHPLLAAADEAARLVNAEVTDAMCRLALLEQLIELADRDEEADEEEWARLLDAIRAEIRNSKGAEDAQQPADDAGRG